MYCSDFISLEVVLCIMQCRHNCLSLSLFADYFFLFVDLPHIDSIHLEPREPKVPVGRGLKGGLERLPLGSGTPSSEALLTVYTVFMAEFRSCWFCQWLGPTSPASKRWCCMWSTCCLYLTIFSRPTISWKVFYFFPLPHFLKKSYCCDFMAVCSLFA